MKNPTEVKSGSHIEVLKATSDVDVRSGFALFMMLTFYINNATINLQINLKLTKEDVVVWMGIGLFFL